jgi:hypothetical protein
LISLALLRVLDLLVDVIDAARLIHVFNERAVVLRVALRSGNDCCDLLDGATRDADKGADLVSGLRRPFIQESFLIFLRWSADRGRNLLRQRPPVDGFNLARQEVLAVKILGEFTAHNLGEINHSHRDLSPLQLFERRETPCSLASVTTTGCKCPTSLILRARLSMSPMSLR